MSNKEFLLLATSLKRSTGPEIEQVGLDSETRTHSLVISGDLETDYDLCYEFAEKKSGEWKEAFLNTSQEDVLRTILKREVELVREELEQEMRIENDNRQAGIDEARYGTPGALYSSGY